MVSTLHGLSTELHSDSWKFSGELGRFSTSDRKVEEQIRIEAEYFSHNAPPDALLHLFGNNISSSVLARSKLLCKTIIGSRLKQSGTFWTLRGANADTDAILALLANRLSGCSERYWEKRFRVA